MDEIRFSVLHKKDLKGKEYVELRPGKHRKKKFHQSSIYIPTEVFLMFKGLIWEKYREYSPTTTNAISSHDWLRILDGLNEFLQVANTDMTIEQLKEALYVRPHQELPKYEDFASFRDDIIGLIKEMDQWVRETTQSESYVSICI
ncbi:MAG: hypothetical protein ACVCEJ_03065 [Candidatus Izemoplasmataceae bacterium]